MHAPSEVDLVAILKIYGSLSEWVSLGSLIWNAGYMLYLAFIFLGISIGYGENFEGEATATDQENNRHCATNHQEAGVQRTESNCFQNSLNQAGATLWTNKLGMTGTRVDSTSPPKWRATAQIVTQTIRSTKNLGMFITSLNWTPYSQVLRT